jgi:DNA-binding MarR family transcriptional regulator
MMVKSDNKSEDVAELICELTRNCNIKEEFFAASFNLSPTEVRLLKLFAFENTFSIKEIRNKLNLSAGRISHILRSLEAKKLLTRITDDMDKRNTIVKLLPNASPFIQNLHQNYNRLHKDLLKNVNRVEMNNIYLSLEVLVDIFKKWVQEK